MSTGDDLSMIRALFGGLIEEAERDPIFASKLARALQGARRSLPPPTSKPRAPFDPYTVAREGEETLQKALAPLELPELRRIISEHGLDRSRLALKWKDRKRVSDHIVSTVLTRLRKGDAFRDDAGRSARTNPVEKREKAMPIAVWISVGDRFVAENFDVHEL